MRTYYVILLCSFMILTACKKDFLDAKPDLNKVVPATIDDYQALLDDDSRMNNFYPSMGDVSCDDVWTTSTLLNTLNITLRNAYVWEEDVFNDNVLNDWNSPYRTVFQSNVVLEGINKIVPAAYRKAEWNNVKGSALFYRSIAFERMMQQFAKPYDAASAANDMGIALRLDPDLNEKSVRAPVKDCYDRIIADLKEAATLLPDVGLYKTRPSRAAAYALLARTYLNMRIYDEAGRYADSSLKYYSILLDYNTLNASATFPIPMFNAEVVFHARTSSVSSFMDAAVGRIDSVLYKSYHADDLRKKLFFKVVSGNVVSYCGSYAGIVAPFGGIATDEVYFIRAESRARSGDKDGAMMDVNTVLQKRWKTGLFTPFTASNAGDALLKVLTERRKELLMRNLRWSDLRRLNKEPQFAVTINRMLNSQTSVLPPNDNRYVFPIPKIVITQTGMPQNPR